MSNALPRDLRGTMMGGGTAAGMLATVLASSPRVVGEVAHAGGRLAGPVVRGGRSLPDLPPETAMLAYQLSRASDPSLTQR